MSQEDVGKVRAMHEQFALPAIPHRDGVSHPFLKRARLDSNQ